MSFPVSIKNLSSWRHTYISLVSILMSIWEPWLKKTLHFSGCCWICESNSMRLYKRLVFIIYDLQTIGKTGSDLYKVSCFQRDAVSEKMCNMPCQYFDLLQSKGLDFEYAWSYASRFQSQKFGLMDSLVTLLLFESRSYGTLLSQVVEVDQVGGVQNTLARLTAWSTR